MKNCENCKYADWRRTEKGRLHPSGAGRCTVEVKMPVLPASMFWIGYSPSSTPKPSGGSINRKRELNEHCPRYAPQEPK